MKRIILVILFTLISGNFSANVLYLSNVASPSHFIWCRSLLHSLVDKGHNITALSPDVEKSSAQLTYLHLEKIYSMIHNGTENVDFFDLGKLSSFQLVKAYLDFSSLACAAAMISDGYKKLLDYPSDFKVIAYYFQTYKIKKKI